MTRGEETVPESAGRRPCGASIGRYRPFQLADTKDCNQPVWQGLPHLVERVIRGGYPVVQKRTSRRRQDWHANYVETLVQRDVRDSARIGSLDALPKLLTLAASQTARLANLSELAGAFQLSRPTIHNYLSLIERLFLVEFLPPWFSNRVKRLFKTPKLHFGDTGLGCSLLRCNTAELDDQPELLGQLLETFVFGEIAKQASAHPERIALHHLPDKDGYEVDIVVQLGTSHAGIEIKAASSVGERDFRGLTTLGDGDAHGRYEYSASQRAQAAMAAANRVARCAPGGRRALRRAQPGLG